MVDPSAMPEGNGSQGFSERVTELVARLGEVTVKPQCPTCQENSWDIGGETVVMPQTPPNPKGQALEVLPLICKRCGHVRLYSTRHLEQGADEERPTGGTQRP